MPADNGSRSDPDERLRPPRPERFQRDPEQFVRGGQSRARSLGVQSQQLPAENQVFENEILPGTESADHSAEEMPERQDCGRNHVQNLIETSRLRLVFKPFISRVHEVLTWDSRKQR